jgi:hypothetical protein
MVWCFVGHCCAENQVDCVINGIDGSVILLLLAKEEPQHRQAPPPQQQQSERCFV